MVISYNPGISREGGRGEDYLMAEKMDPKETVSIEGLLMSIVMEQAALINTTAMHFLVDSKTGIEYDGIE